MLSSVLSCVLGTYASYFIDGATGGCIVVLQGIFFIAAFVFAPKHGMIAKGRERQRQQLEDTLEVAGAVQHTLSLEAAQKLWVQNIDQQVQP